MTKFWNGASDCPYSPGIRFRPTELPIHDIKPFKATLVDVLHDVRANAGELADLFVGERVTGQQEADVVFQFLRDGMVHGADVLFFGNMNYT